jgi:LuxR family transcriptional regulator, maltose regulon positive regulatory protein
VDPPIDPRPDRVERVRPSSEQAAPPIAGELHRPRVIQLLAQRFERRVVLVRAGAGFGKSTALAQAIRHHDLGPVGQDVLVSCRPGDEHGDRLAASILRAIDGQHEAIGTTSRR